MFYLKLYKFFLPFQDDSLLCPAPGMEIFKVLFDGFEKNFGM
jgi:hypothetical protein